MIKNRGRRGGFYTRKVRGDFQISSGKWQVPELLNARRCRICFLLKWAGTTGEGKKGMCNRSHARVRETKAAFQDDRYDGARRKAGAHGLRCKRASKTLHLKRSRYYGESGNDKCKRETNCVYVIMEYVVQDHDIRAHRRLTPMLTFNEKPFCSDSNSCRYASTVSPYG